MLLKFFLPLLLAAGISFWAVQSPAGRTPVTLDDLWEGRAHFAQVGEIRFGDGERGGAVESSSWFAARQGVWFAFNRFTVAAPTPDCPSNNTRVIVRASRDKGKSWSSPVTAVEPGSSKGDGCAVLDGSTYFDDATGTWHLLAQCLDRKHVGGWALCHYVRRDPSPVGRFAANRANPVVSGGQLWAKICSGRGKSCAAGTLDEGTPDILYKDADGQFVVTFHGFHPQSGRGYRGVARTPDFTHWRVDEPGLPNDAILGPLECRSLMRGCAGFGQATAIVSDGHVYAVAEYMQNSLLCTKDQDWAFALLRAPANGIPRSGRGGWEAFRKTPLLTRSWPDSGTPCALAYARWLVDGADVYLIYEDWEPKHAYLHRRLLKLMPGGGNPVRLASPAR